MCNDEQLDFTPVVASKETGPDEVIKIETTSEVQEVQQDAPLLAEDVTVRKVESHSQPLAVLDEFSAKLQSLETLFSRRLSYDAGKEKILDKLHSELQDYKSDLYAKLTRPIFYDIAVVLDDIRKVRIGLDAEKQSESDAMLESIAESLVFLLDKYEVIPYASEPGTKYDANKQRMVKSIGTTDPTQVGLIAGSVSAGYIQNEQIIYPEKVAVYKLEVM